MLELLLDGMQHFFLLLNLMIISRAAGRIEDYWSDDFDPNKNCVQEEKIIKLRNPEQGELHPDEMQDNFSQCTKESVSIHYYLKYLGLGSNVTIADEDAT